MNFPMRRAAARRNACQSLHTEEWETVMNILTLDKVKKSYGLRVLFDDVTLLKRRRQDDAAENYRRPG